MHNLMVTVFGPAGPGRRQMMITVVVAAHGRPEQLARTLPRHLALPERPRVVVVDDASPEPLAVPPGVSLVRLERDAGESPRNVGARAAGTPYVAFTDDDAWWEPGALAAACALLDRHPRLALVQPHVLVGADERDDPTCLEMARSPLPPAPGQPGHNLLGFIACAVVVRVAAFAEVGGFHARLGVGGEEELLGSDLAAAGWQLSYVPEIVAHHAPPPRTDGRPERRETLLRNALWTAWLRRPAATAARHTAHALARAPRDRVTVRAVARALAASPWLLRERRVSPPAVEAQRRLLEESRGG
jgi:GT2 family glycosyltransferase